MLEILCADEPVARWRNDAVVRRLVTHEKRNKWGSRVVNEFKKKWSLSRPYTRHVSVYCSGQGDCSPVLRACDAGQGKRQLDLLKSSPS